MVRKWIVGLTGLGLVGFLVAHMTGNVLIYKEGAMNAYAKGLHDLSILPLLEIGLMVMFVLHIGLVIGFVMQSNKAKGGGKYAVTASKRKEGGIFELISAKAMAISGMIVLAFLVVHILDFRLQREEIEGVSGGVEAYTKTTLAVGWKAILYAVASLLVGWHIFRGIQSGFRSLGFYHEKYSPLIHKGGRVLSVIVGLGFASIPLWILVTQ
ncbi:MAG: succinate dehydrogenase cytochrome b subunit [Bradymonadia bacterium]